MVYVRNFNLEIAYRVPVQLGLERVRRKNPKPTPLPHMRLWLLHAEVFEILASELRKVPIVENELSVSCL